MPEFKTLFKIKCGLGDDESKIYPFDKIFKHEFSKMTSLENDQKEKHKKDNGLFNLPSNVNNFFNSNPKQNTKKS